MIHVGINTELFFHSLMCRCQDVDDMLEVRATTVSVTSVVVGLETVETEE